MIEAFVFTFSPSVTRSSDQSRVRKLSSPSRATGDEFIVIASICCLPFEKWWNENVIIYRWWWTNVHAIPLPASVLNRIIHSKSPACSEGIWRMSSNGSRTVIFLLLWISINNSAINHTSPRRDEEKETFSGRKKLEFFNSHSTNTKVLPPTRHVLRPACAPHSLSVHKL